MVVKSQLKVLSIIGIVCPMWSLMNIINFLHICAIVTPDVYCDSTECLVCNDCLITSSCKQIADYIANSVLQIKKLLINYGYHHIFCPGVVMTILENQSVWSLLRTSSRDLFMLNWFITTLHLWRKINSHWCWNVNFD